MVYFPTGFAAGQFSARRFPASHVPFRLLVHNHEHMGQAIAAPV